jgi:hypothetical protein
MWYTGLPEYCPYLKRMIAGDSIASIRVMLGLYMWLEVGSFETCERAPGILNDDLRIFMCMCNKKIVARRTNKQNNNKNNKARHKSWQVGKEKKEGRDSKKSMVW